MAEGATAVGSGAAAYNTNSTAIGYGAIVSSNNSVALGADSVASGIHTGAYSINGGVVAGAPFAANGVVSVGSVGTERQMQNVGAGVVSATSTDAVNGSQLFFVGTALNTAASGAAASLGGGAGWNAGAGTWTGPSYALNGATYTNTGSALVAVNTSVNTLGVTTASSLGGGSIYTPGGGLSAPAYVIQGTSYNNVGSALSAVNSSISGLNQTVSGLGQNLNALAGQVANNQREARQGIAMAAAMASVGMPTGAGRTAWRVNSSFYMGAGAVSMGLAHRLPLDIPLALTAGASVGFNNTAIVSVGLQGQF
ncbi:MAG: hypothetical protein HQ465_00335 [Rhodospirillales bacterium]|nr:hypothetical protein [Rhodospirillales bacterium]